MHGAEEFSNLARQFHPVTNICTLRKIYFDVGLSRYLDSQHTMTMTNSDQHMSAQVLAPLSAILSSRASPVYWGRG